MSNHTGNAQQRGFARRKGAESVLSSKQASKACPDAHVLISLANTHTACGKREAAITRNGIRVNVTGRATVNVERPRAATMVLTVRPGAPDEHRHLITFNPASKSAYGALCPCRCWDG